MSDILELSNKDFNQNLQLVNPQIKKKAFVMFFSPRCGHCKALHPTVEQLAAKVKNGELGSNVTIAQVNTTNNQDLMTRINDTKLNQFTVYGVPTCVSYEDGKYYSTYGQGDKGSHSYRSLEDLIDYVNGIGVAEITYVQE